LPATLRSEPLTWSETTSFQGVMSSKLSSTLGAGSTGVAGGAAEAASDQTRPRPTATTACFTL